MIAVDLIAAARPNFMKVAPLYKALGRAGDWCRPRIVHTGQHYDANMSDAFFADLGLPEPQVRLGVGNIMIDSLEMMPPVIEARRYRAKLRLERGGYGVATLHRPSNVDDPRRLRELVDLIVAAAAMLPVVFPVHPRTRRRLEETQLLGPLLHANGVFLTEPLSYTAFMSLVLDCRYALTDSDGIQEEATYLAIPCITPRDNTERPITVTQGTNELATPESAIALIARAVAGVWKKGRIPERWDGQTAGRVVASLAQRAR